MKTSYVTAMKTEHNPLYGNVLQNYQKWEACHFFWSDNYINFLKWLLLLQIFFVTIN